MPDLLEADGAGKAVLFATSQLAPQGILKVEQCYIIGHSIKKTVICSTLILHIV